MFRVPAYIIHLLIYLLLFISFIVKKNSVILPRRYHNQIGVWIDIMFIKDTEAEGISLEEIKQLLPYSLRSYIKLWQSTILTSFASCFLHKSPCIVTARNT